MLAQAKQRADIISAGNKYFVDGKWSNALAEFEKAAQMGLDDTLKVQIAECKFQITLAEAHKLRMERRYAEALAAYEKAKAMKPSAAALINPYEELMATDQQYNKLMADGKEALKKNQWAKARAFFEEARKSRDTAEVKEAIADTRYGENLARGIEAYEQNNITEARSYFKLAQGFKNTPEVQEWIRKCEEALKAASPG
jgi:tetratricopeptide (TPR) repeat protein